MQTKACFIRRSVGVLRLLAATIASGLVWPSSGVESIGGDRPPRAARSVHLGWQAPESDLFYVEMAAEQTAPGSYFMAAGWSGGYFGIQELTDGRRVSIFSVWDPTKGDDPGKVKAEDRVELLHEAEGVRIRRFGGEGTGGQCMLPFAWELGQTNRFLVHAAIQGDKTAYTGYVFFQESREWRRLVTFRTRTGGKALRGIYSFVEDFRRDGRSVNEVRSARFGNGWVRTVQGTWQPLTRARFTASGASWEARDNISAGVGKAGLFLATGGETIQTLDLSSMLTNSVIAGAPPDDLPAPASSRQSGAGPHGTSP
jgi:hypothetical protein